MAAMLPSQPVVPPMKPGMRRPRAFKLVDSEPQEDKEMVQPPNQGVEIGPTFDILPPMKDARERHGPRRASINNAAAAAQTQDALGPMGGSARGKSKSVIAPLEQQRTITETLDLESKRSAWKSNGELSLPFSGRHPSGDLGMKTEKTLSMVALDEIASESDGEGGEDSFSDSGMSSNGSAAITPYQDELLESLVSQSVHVLKAWESHGKPNIAEKCAAVCVATMVPSTVDAQDLVEDLASRKLSAPILVLLMRPAKQANIAREVLQKEISKFLSLGTADVVLQPLSEDPETFIDMWLARAAARAGQEKEINQKVEDWAQEVEGVLNLASEREDGLFWEQLHNFFDGLPKLNPRLQEPEKGGTLGNNHKILDVINSGAFSDVFLVENSKKEQQAMKAVRKEKLGRFDLVRCISNEVRILRRLRHNNVVRFFGTAHSREHIIILMELVGKQNLFNFIRSYDQGEQKGKMEPMQAQILFQQMVLGLSYCHDQFVSHRDIKPENFALSSDGTHIKLVDFGMADDLDAPLKYKGTMPFIAPEVMEEDHARYNPVAADMWSLGVVLVEMVCGLHTLTRILKWKKGLAADKNHAKDVRALMGSSGRFLTLLQEHLRPRFESSQGLLDLIQGILSVDNGSRWTSLPVLKCGWLKPVAQK